MTGSGTPADPFVIWNVVDLQNISLDLTAWYELGQNIDATGFAFIPLGIFTGTFDGKAYRIINLTITNNGAGVRNAALFRENQGTIQDLGFENCAITGTSTNGGQCRTAAVCYDNNGGTISDVWVTGTITGSTLGLTGAWVQAAGLVAWNEGGTIRRCRSDAVVIAMSGGNALVGGLVAENEGIISESYSTGDVTGTITVGNGDLYVGSFSGTNGFAADGTINDSYARGSATANAGNPSYAGGFIAANMTAGSRVTRAYSTGISTAATIAGGFCALDNGTITDSFWDTQTSGQTTSDGGTGKTTAEMKSLATFLDADWDIQPRPLDKNNGYPYLAWQSVWHIFVVAGPPPAISVLTLAATEVR